MASKNEIKPKHYIEKIDYPESKVKIWRVDGMLIRNTIDVNFNNAGHHFSFKFIPKDELWIDKDFSKRTDDENMIIKQCLHEIKLYKRKYRWIKVVTEAFEQAKKDRKMLNNISPSEAYNKLYVKKLRKYCTDSVKVLLVNGKIVRDVFYVDFTEGGHHYVYNFVPKSEVWIDDSLNPLEYDYVIFHEVIERNLMKFDKLKYDDAHEIAINYENTLRRLKVEPKALIYHEIERKK